MFFLKHIATPILRHYSSEAPKVAKELVMSIPNLREGGVGFMSKKIPEDFVKDIDWTIPSEKKSKKLLDSETKAIIKELDSNPYPEGDLTP